MPFPPEVDTSPKIKKSINQKQRNKETLRVLKKIIYVESYLREFGIQPKGKVPHPSPCNLVKRNKTKIGIQVPPPLSEIKPFLA